MVLPPVRHAAVAGRFYPGNREELLEEVQFYASGRDASVRALGCVVPHAGYIYSGPVAGAVYGSLKLPKRFVILCPNHTGVGRPLAIMSFGLWSTPLGEARIDKELASIIKTNFPPLTEDDAAHRSEHAIEVQLPFLQALVSDFSFVPITVGTSHYGVLEELGEAIGSVLRDDDLVIASSDMNHYESDEITRKKDTKALDRVLHLDPRGLFDIVAQENISMCGFAPTIVMLTAAKSRGAKRAQLLKYGTSGDVSGEKDMVVGYAGVVIT